MKKSQKKVVAVLFTLILTFFLVYIGLNKDANHVYGMQLDHFEESFTELKNEKEIIDQEIKTLYADENQTFIIDSLTVEEIDEYQKKIASYEDKLLNFKNELSNLMAQDQKIYTEKMKEYKIIDSIDNLYIDVNDLKIKQAITNQINNLFAKKYVENKEINKDVFITETLELKEFEKSQKNIERQLKENELKNEKEFTEIITAGLKIATEQLDDLHEAVALRNELFDENNYLTVANTTKIADFLLVIEKIKNPELQSTFDEYIRIAENYEVEELKKESEATNEVDSSYLENQESSNYKRPSIGSPSNDSYSGGSTGNPTGGSSVGSPNSSSGESTSGSTNDSTESSSDSSNDESTDESIESNSADDSTDSTTEESPMKPNDESSEESDYNAHHETQQ